MQSRFCGWFWPFQLAGLETSWRPDSRRDRAGKAVRRDSHIPMLKSDRRFGSADTYEENNPLLKHTICKPRWALSMMTLTAPFLRADVHEPFQIAISENKPYDARRRQIVDSATAKHL